MYVLNCTAFCSDYLDYDDTALRDDDLQDLIFDLAYPFSRSVERLGGSKRVLG